MSLFVYKTENCRLEAASHGMSAEVDKLIERVESTQSLSLFDPFPPPYLVKKKIGGRQGRLIADLRDFGDHTIVVLLTVMIRGDRAYEAEFSRDPLAYGKQHLGDLVTTAELIEFVQERTKLSVTFAKPEPSNEEYAMLYDAFAHQNGQGVSDLVCETPNWVTQVAQERISKQLVLLSTPCLNALSGPMGLHFSEITQKTGWGIWTHRSPGRLLLISISTDPKSDDAENIAKKVNEAIDGQDGTTVLRASQRAYPSILLADDDLWIDLEREPVANMALSPEESSVLESARQSGHAFPLFINGRAGSGKSTILQYLFADLLFYYISQPFAESIAPPIYLTANGDLLRNARSFIERLLRSEATFVQQISGETVDSGAAILDAAFREFQSFQLSLLSQDDRRNKFSLSGRVDYPRFRRMWAERFSNDPRALREYGPDLSWHVIRSYIKGVSSETFLDPSDYALLPENQLTVTHETFGMVYEKVWLNWYERIFEAQGLWDDQDLTRYILDEDLVQSTHPAVFCDEAQDFTRLELEMLLRLSLFSNRNLPSTDISRVPFAFAGDQFQTLNPTGFRWDAIKASFVEKFIYELHPSRRSVKTDLNFQELKYNYRSTHKIVRFSNHVQALRAALFGLPDLMPQLPWAENKSSPQVVWFRSNDANFWNKFRDDPSFVVIVPCNEGEEGTYVQQDPTLKQHVAVEEGVPRNILSATRAKGCEYANVVVYGFGATEMLDVSAKFCIDDSERVSPNNSDESLPLQYFINRLYVAVSRAKRRLVIVDSEAGFSKLWGCTTDEAIERKMLSFAKNGVEVWSHQIEGMVAGVASDLSRDNAADPSETARAFEFDGLSRRDSFLLKQAAISYRAAGDLAKARECRARAFEVDGDDFEAGKGYLEAGFVTEGARCLWLSGRAGWIFLCDVVSQYPQLVNELEVVWASSVCGKPNIERAANVLQRLEQRLNSDPKFIDEVVGGSVWRDALSALILPLLEVQRGDSTSEVAKKIVDVLDRIQGHGVRLPDKAFAQVCFFANRFGQAAALWEKIGDTRTGLYFKAKAESEPYPQNIDWYIKAGQFGQLLSFFDSSPTVVLTEDRAAAVAEQLYQSKRFEDILILCQRTPGSRNLLLAFALRFRREHMLELANRALSFGVARIAEGDNWDSLAGFLKDGEFTPDKNWKDKVVRAWVKEQGDEIRIALVKTFARSHQLASAPIQRQQMVSTFLREYLRVKEGRWQKWISYPEAGAAIERTGRHVDAMAFYEAVLREKIDRETEQFAQSRWMVAKLRQLEHERSHGSPDRVSQLESQIRDRSSEWRCSPPTSIADYPELAPVVLALPKKAARQVTLQTELVAAPIEIASLETSQKAKEVVLQKAIAIHLGVLRIELSPSRERCNITNTDTLETAAVKLREGTIVGEGDFSLVVDNRWHSHAWDLTISIHPSPDVLISFAQKKLGVQASISSR